jgi:[acyl-carrier-protein] S-malonyltransferase
LIESHLKMNLAYLFPGQGSQKIGMGSALAGQYPSAAKIFQTADNILGISLSRLCFDGPAEELNETRNAQPALLVVSVALAQVLKENGITPSIAAGHSLGEYSALVAAGVLKFEECLSLVRRRAEIMAEVGRNKPGSMAAVLGLKDEKVEEICRNAASDGVVEPANYNCPGQVVISGETKAVARAAELAKQEGAKRVLPLKVSIASHCALMHDAAQKYSGEIEKVTWSTPEVPIVMNVTGEATTDIVEIKKCLVQQLYNPVRWTKSVRAIADSGVNRAVELGPGKVLTGLMTRCSPETKVYPVSNPDSINDFLQLKGNN